jgi:hypothetical protein
MSSQFQRLSKVLAKSFKLSHEELIQSFRVASATDITAISNMRRQIFGSGIHNDDKEYLKWRYFRSSDLPSTLWVLEYKGAIIAAMGIEPVEIINCGKREPAIRGMDVMVDPEFDNRGLGAWMALVLQERHTCILVCGGNDNSKSMLRKLFHSMPARQYYKLMLRSNGYLKKKAIAPIAKVIALIINPLLTCHHHLKWRQIAPAADVTVYDIESIDELTRFLPEATGLLGEIKVHRSAEYLSWRYKKNPRANVRIVGAFKKNQLIGYVIYDLSTIDTIKIGRIVDSDIFSPESIAKNLSALYLHAAKCSQRLGAEQILITLNDNASIEAAKHTGFIVRETDSELFVYYKDAKPDDPIYLPDLWYQSTSDSDAEGI